MVQLEAGMALPKIVVRGKKVILLSGYCKDDFKGVREAQRLGGYRLKVDAEDQLLAAARKNPDAVAFGYVAGQWVASA
ncbi:hypothetical protein GL4_2766 [Methyloceanibacter caenitepidi]|uniref:Uncharacterized protein n=2 Tax=Methyloceanibacter caenitepidi TaxID=1384459 RepID=A0A0A8K5L4_9HYPH|nr:hypothetical protein GL4_2766 [Methyloceanibacter caenitepidi]